MPTTASSDNSKPSSPLELADELAELWVGSLRDKGWPERLDLLMDVHEQIREDIGSFETYCEVSPEFIARLIERLGVERVRCVEQAHIYSNSARREHRDAAGAWLAEHYAKSGAGPAR